MQPVSMRVSPLGTWQNLRARTRPNAGATAVPLARPAAIAPKPRPVGPLDGFKLKAGSTFAIAPGTTVRGYPVTGTARVVSVDGKHVEMRVQGTAGGIVGFDVRFRAATQADGTLKLTADLKDANGGPARSLLAQQARIVQATPGDLRLRAADGKNARLVAAGQGLRIQVEDLNLNLVRTA